MHWIYKVFVGILVFQCYSGEILIPIYQMIELFYTTKNIIERDGNLNAFNFLLLDGSIPIVLIK